MKQLATTGSSKSLWMNTLIDEILACSSSTITYLNCCDRSSDGEVKPLIAVQPVYVLSGNNQGYASAHTASGFQFVRICTVNGISVFTSLFVIWVQSVGTQIDFERTKLQEPSFAVSKYSSILSFPDATSNAMKSQVGLPGPQSLPLGSFSVTVSV